ncbi:MAG TPA: lamin tail domain-containing protein [Myxococcota bacterium]|nr:lamin tail domain-containing protein [Myxococcota bacterium]
MSRSFVFALLVAGACTPDADDLYGLDGLAVDQAAPPGVLTLTVTPVVPGLPATFRVTGAQANTNVMFFRGAAVQPNGFCPPPIAPACLDLRSPVTNQFQARSNAQGVAQLTLNIPNPLPIASAAFQAGYPRAPTIDSSNAVNVIIHQPNSDMDGDGLTAQQEVGTFHTDPAQADSDGGGMDDGDEIAAGNNPLDPSDDNLGGPLSIDDLGPGDIVITEIMKDPDSPIADGDGEWFEILNMAGADIDLHNMLLSDDGTDNHRVNASVVVPDGAYATLGISNNSAVNGGLTHAYSYAGAAFLLSNDDDEVVLENAGGEIARVAFDNGITFPDLPGASLSLSPSHLNETANDTGANWCATPTHVYSAPNKGTPGAVNDACPPPPPTWVADVKPIIDLKCAGCHTNGGASGGRSWNTYADMFQQSIEVPLLKEIKAFDRQNSYMWHKLNGTQGTVGGSGSRMPLSGGFLNTAQLNTFQAWIDGGAREQ